MNNGDILVMRQKELKRLELVKKAIGKGITQAEAAKFLELSQRQVRRIVKRVKLEGEWGVIHKARGKHNCRRLTEEFKAKVLGAYVRRYKGFGPSLACEKLAKEKIFVNRETLRRWLLEGSYVSRRRSRRKHRQWRKRKAYCGQMVQMDGSHHDWLEGRGPRLVLMGYIDDATNRIFGRFYEYEGTIPALDSFKRYCLKYGIPQSVYLDKHTTYKSNQQEQWKLNILGQGDGLSEFERCLKALDVHVIHANSPQAKGRIERLFRTLQDRLVKELRLADAKTIEQANDVLNGYLVEHNERYIVAPAKRTNVHRSASSSRELDDILCIKTEHVVRNDFTVAHNKCLYQILCFTSAKKIQVREHVDGRMEFIGTHNNRLSFKKIFNRPMVKPKRISAPTRRERIKLLIGLK